MLSSILSVAGVIAPTINKVIDRIIPDKAQADEFKLKLLELQQSGEFKQIEASLESERLAQVDRDSARKREETVKDSVPRNLAYLISSGFFISLFLLVFVDIDADIVEVLKAMSEMLKVVFIMIIGYYFGATNQKK